ncbi:MAG: FAD:protein FMN transferase [Candidatus Omnitrophota bacterium]
MDKFISLSPDKKKAPFIFCILAFSFFLCSCAQPLRKDTFVISGTYLKVTSPDSRAAKIVYEEFKRLDKIFNLYDSDSEIARLNRSQNASFKTSKELIEVLSLSRQTYLMSNGVFDVSNGALYSFWKELIQKEDVESFPLAEEINKLKQFGGMESIELNLEENTVLIKNKGLKIDLSAIAKGYMVDKAVQKLKQAGIDSALINAGGDIYCLGKPESFKKESINPVRSKPPWAGAAKRASNGVNSFWRVGIKDPGELAGIIENQVLLNEAIATSGDYEQFFEFNGEKYSHLINPKTGYPVKNNILSVSVVTQNCTTADSLASAFFVMGLEGIKEFLSKTPSTMRIFVVFLDENNKKSIRVFQ